VPVPTPQIFLSYELELSWFVWKITFFVKKISGGGVPPPLPPNNHSQQFLIPTLPIHCDTFMQLQWRLRKKSYSANSKGNARKQRSPTMAKCEWKHLASPSLECKKKFQGAGAPKGGGTYPPIFCAMNSNFGEMWKITFFVKKVLEVGYPLNYPQNNHSQQFLIPTLPIHCDTFMELRWRLRGATRGVSMLRPKLAKKPSKFYVFGP